MACEEEQKHTHAQTHAHIPTFQVRADTCFRPIHVDHRCVRRFEPHKGILSEGQPHVVAGGFQEISAGKSQTPIFILEVGILGHRGLFTHFEDYLLCDTR